MLDSTWNKLLDKQMVGTRGREGKREKGEKFQDGGWHLLEYNLLINQPECFAVVSISDFVMDCPKKAFTCFVPMLLIEAGGAARLLEKPKTGLLNRVK